MHFDQVVRGLAFRLSPGGARTWVFVYRTRTGRQRYFTIGRYPDVSLATAREEARDLREHVRKGGDPVADRVAAKTVETFADLATLYLEKHAKPHKRTWAVDERLIQRELLPSWRHRPIPSITRGDVRALIENIAERGPIQANRILALVRKMFNFAISRDQLSVNPCVQIERPGKEQCRERVLSEDEIRRLWVALDDEETKRPVIAAYYRLRLLTIQRGQEVETMRWVDLDAPTRTWTIPGTVTKNGLTHIVPLSPVAWVVLDRLRAQRDETLAKINLGRARKKWPLVTASQWVFPSPRRSRGDRSIGRHLQNAVDRLRDVSGVTDWTGHDLRRTGASHMTAGGVPRLTVQKILNHVETGVTAVYDRHSYLPEMRGALDWWGIKVQSIVGQMDVGKVLPFTRTTST